MFIFGLLVGLVVGVMATGLLVLWVTSWTNFGEEFHKAYHGDTEDPHKAYEAEPESPVVKWPVQAGAFIPGAPLTLDYSDEQLAAVKADFNNKYGPGASTGRAHGFHSTPEILYPSTPADYFEAQEPIQAQLQLVEQLRAVADQKRDQERREEDRKRQEQRREESQQTEEDRRAADRTVAELRVLELQKEQVEGLLQED
jgi:hypothetical protein